MNRNIGLISLLSTASIWIRPATGQEAAPPVQNETGVEYSVERGSILLPNAKMAFPLTQARSPEPAEDDRAYLLSVVRWSTPEINVCWENPQPNNNADRALVRQAISETWARYSALRFTDWGTCNAASRGIRIRISDTGPHTKGLGNMLDGLPDGMVLNFTYDNWSPSCKTMRTSCIVSIAAHELGHALGFAHEQNRPDTPGECTELPQGQSGDIMLTPWDPSSVMNYCNPVYNNDGHLSAWDITALQTVYGKPNP